MTLKEKRKVLELADSPEALEEWLDEQAGEAASGSYAEGAFLKIRAQLEGEVRKILRQHKRSKN